MSAEANARSMSHDLDESPRVESAARPLSSASCLSSASLFRGQREIVILHHGQEYRLRITKADKLILTK